jgi:hypothetical protein
MPIAPFESEILHRLAANRNPESFVGGATVLHQQKDSPRASRDIDLFHDTAVAVRLAAELDIDLLRKAQYVVNLSAQHDAFWRAEVTRGPLGTKVEWVYDSAFRFFPVEQDVELGWRLNFWDVATNKVLALIGRDKLRDWIDVLYLNRSHLPLGPLVWAAAAKDPGLTPEMILDSARRFGRFPATPNDWIALGLSPPDDLTALKKEFLEMTWDAQRLVEKLPPSEMGCLYLDSSGRPVRPDPGAPEFQKLTRHFGSIKGAWPRIADP